VRTPIVFDLDLGLDEGQGLVHPTTQFNSVSFETRVLASLETSLSALKGQFLEELRLLLDSCTYEECVATFTTQLHSELREIIASFEINRAVEMPVLTIDHEFQKLTLPQRNLPLRNAGAVVDEMGNVAAQFAESTTAILERTMRAHTEMRQMKTPVVEIGPPGSRGLTESELAIDRAQVRQRIMKEQLDSRLARLTSERAAFHDRQAETEDIAPESTFIGIHSMNGRNSIQSLSKKVQELSRVVQDVSSAIQLTSGHIQMSAEVISCLRAPTFANTARQPPPREPNVLCEAKAKLQAIEHHRHETKHRHPFLISI
jgi:methyl-accepting chemotaxis protein